MMWKGGWHRPAMLFQGRGVLLSGAGAVLLTMAVSFAQTVGTSRILGPDGRGVIAQVVVVVMLTALVFGLSLEFGVMNEIAGQRVEVRTTILTSLRYASAAALLSVCAAAALLVAWPSTDAVAVPVDLVLATAVVPLVLAGPAVALARATGRGHIAQWLPAATIAVPMSVSLGGVMLVRTIDAAVLSYALGAWLVLAGEVLLFSKIIAGVSDGVSTSPPIGGDVGHRSILSSSLRGHPGVVLHTLIISGPLLLVGAFAGDSAAGVYSAGYSLSAVALLYSSSIISIVLTSAMRYPTDFSTLRSSLMLTAVITSVLAVVMVVFSWMAADLLFGDGFGTVWEVAALLGPGMVALALWRVLSYDLAVRGWQSLRTLSSGVGAVGFLVTWGLVGAESPGSGAIIYSSACISMLLAAVALGGVRRRHDSWAW